MEGSRQRSGEWASWPPWLGLGPLRMRELSPAPQNHESAHGIPNVPHRLIPYAHGDTHPHRHTKRYLCYCCLYLLQRPPSSQQWC